MDIKKILDKIAKRRKKKGYSYENMAEDLGLTPSGYRKIEKGETKLSVERMLQIATVLDLSVSKLFDIEESPEKNKYKETIEKLISSYEKRLKEKDKQIAFLKNQLPN